MATTPREKLEARLRTFEGYVDEGEISPESGEAIRELIDAYNEHNLMVPKPEGENFRQPATLTSWVRHLAVFGRFRELTDTSADELNSDIQATLVGTHPFVKDEGIKKGSARSYQAALRKFYDYHNFGIEPAEIPIFPRNISSVDPNEMLNRDEIHEARSAADNPRDRAVFELLLYTGQRREAIRTLRIKDVDIQEGIYRLNPEVDGLKGANDRNGKRPLLGAKGAIQNWLEYHPAPNEPDAYLITALPNYAAVDPFEPVSGETIRRIMADIKEDTGIKKPMNPHAMRHNFVTIAKRDHDLADDTIKYLIGHSPASDVMETTYSHLSGDDYIERAEQGWGLRDPEEESSLTPEVCSVCGNPLSPHAKACERCGAIYTPDAQAIADKLQTDMNDSYAGIDPEDTDAKQKLDTLNSLLNDPVVKQALLTQMEEA